MRRRASGNVPSSIRLGHGDVLVMDGLAQSEYEHCTASGLQGPRVYLTYRSVAQHTASCPLSRRSGLCATNVCARFSRAKFPLVGRSGKEMVLFLGIGPPFLDPGVCPSGQHLGFTHRRGHCHSSQRLSCLAVHFLSPGSCPLGWGTALATVTTSPIFQGCVFLFPFFIFFW